MCLIKTIESEHFIDIKDFDNIYGLTAIKQSAFQVYSAIFTYNMVGYVSEQIKKKYQKSRGYITKVDLF